ncbi:hypothetical protein GEV33_006444 [Tenebrio molitor]|uniref:Uncharacterized protein n=1 Tax=Tenebrio molitor TaxID=7067 RepID=A0A8J6HL44_TENMO|nr:hypothetical protein GEV33_006444 [Tenebrio molitor]
MWWKSFSKRLHLSRLHSSMDYLIVIIDSFGGTKGLGNCGKERKRNERNDEESEKACEEEKAGRNVEKTKMMVFNKRKRKSEENERNWERRKIERVNEFKYLDYAFYERKENDDINGMLERKEKDRGEKRGREILPEERDKDIDKQERRERIRESRYKMEYEKCMTEEIPEYLGRENAREKNDSETQMWERG